MTTQSHIGEYYRQHHTSGGRYGFTIDGESRGKWFADHVSRFAAKAGQPTLDIMDIGCRDGTLTRFYGAGHRLVGIDVDPDAIVLAREKGIDARAHDLNGATLPFDDQSFDVVIAGEVLEHLQFPSEVVAELRRVLRPKGLLIGSVPNAFRLRNRLTFLLGRSFEVDPTHLHQFSPAMIRELLSGFHGVDLEFHGGRRSRLHPRLMATQLYFRALR